MATWWIPDFRRALWLRVSEARRASVEQVLGKLQRWLLLLRPSFSANLALSASVVFAVWVLSKVLCTVLALCAGVVLQAYPRVASCTRVLRGRGPGCASAWLLGGLRA